MIPLAHTLETPRLRLRACEARDVPFVFDASRAPGFCDGMRWDPPTRPEELLVPLEANLAAWRAGTAYTFMVETRAEARPVGRIVVRRGDEPGTWTLGYWTHPTQMGRGYATEAAGAVIDFAFERLAATSVEAGHATWNAASRRVLEKVGLTFVRHEPRGFLKGGRWVAEDFLAIRAATWRRRKARP